MNKISFPGLSLGPFDVDPVATPESFPFEVRWYGIIIMVGMILGVLYAVMRARKNGISADNLLDYVLFAIPVGIVCARLYYVLFNLSQYHSFRDVIAVWEGGLAIYGGIIGGIVTIFVVSKVKKANFLEILDYFAPAAMIGQILGRWGNFFNAEAFGGLSKITFPFVGDVATPCFENDYVFRMVIEAPGKTPIAVHPTFLYESLWNLIGFIVINLYFKKKKFNGEIAFIYAAWYGFGRFFIEGLRTDSLTFDKAGIFRVSQILALLCVVAGIAFIIIGRRRAAKKSLTLDGYVNCFSVSDEKTEE